MKTAIVTRTVTTSTVSAFDLVRHGWFIQSNINGTITASKQQVCGFKHPELASLRMEEWNFNNPKFAYRLDFITKIDFGPCKVGVVWNDTICRAEAWMHRPEVKLEDVIPKEDEFDDFDSFSSDEDLEAAEAWDTRTSKEEQDWFINRY